MDLVMSDLSKLSNRLPVTGYLNRLSARPGEVIEAKVSVAATARCRTRLVRVISGDPNPAGPGLRFEDRAHQFDHLFDALPQPIRIGSYGEAPAPVPIGSEPWCWTALVCPGLADSTDRIVLYHGDGRNGLSLLVGPGGVSARFAS
jgi:N,N-dimethylformamidase